MGGEAALGTQVRKDALNTDTITSALITAPVC